MHSCVKILYVQQLNPTRSKWQDWPRLSCYRWCMLVSVLGLVSPLLTFYTSSFLSYRCLVSLCLTSVLTTLSLRTAKQTWRSWKCLGSCWASICIFQHGEVFFVETIRGMVCPPQYLCLDKGKTDCNGDLGEEQMCPKIKWKTDTSQT